MAVTRTLKAVVVDDEQLAAAYLKKLISSFDDVEVAGVFPFPDLALDMIRSKEIDVAFLDIEMPGMSGLELLDKIKQCDPGIEVVLVTGYGEYALQAYEKKALGYLLKPCSQEDVGYYLNQVRELRRRRRKQIFDVVAFGNFEVYVDDCRVVFSNAKSKELLALLVDARGAGVSIETIANALWEGHPFDDSAKALVRRAVADLRHVARGHGAEDLVAGERGYVSLNTALISCDLYDYLKNPAAVDYPGEYMAQYSWAEATAAALAFGSIGE